MITKVEEKFMKKLACGPKTTKELQIDPRLAHMITTDLRAKGMTIVHGSDGYRMEGGCNGRRMRALRSTWTDPQTPPDIRARNAAAIG